MANVSTPFKRALFRVFCTKAEAKGGTILDELNTALCGKVEHAGMGLFLVGTSSDGTSTSYAIPSAGRGYGPSEILEAIEELITRHEQAVAAIIAAGTPTPTEAQIKAEILALLVPIREVFSDFTSLRAC